MLQSHTMNKSGQSLTPNYGKSFNNLTWMQPEHAQLRTSMRYLILEIQLVEASDLEHQSETKVNNYKAILISLNNHLCLTKITQATS